MHWFVELSPELESRIKLLIELMVILIGGNRWLYYAYFIQTTSNAIGQQAMISSSPPPLYISHARLSRFSQSQAQLCKDI